MNGYKILTVMVDGTSEFVEMTCPTELTAIEMFRIVMREHSASIISAHLFRFNAGKWQHMLRKA